MKTITKLLCLLAFIAITTKGYAQQETTYGFGYAYTHGTKTLYITNIVSGVVHSSQYYDASTVDLKLQWTEKFKTVVNNYYNYTIATAGFFGVADKDYDSVDKERTQVIAKYKQEGFTIHYVNTFNYTKEKLKT